MTQRRYSPFHQGLPPFLWFMMIYGSLMGLTLFGCQPSSPENAQIKREWTSADDPSLMGENFVLEYAKLPTEGNAARPPWPGSYWPTYKDGINERWDGANSDSPAMKYQKAFKKTFNVEDKVSADFGIDSLKTAASCTKQSQCKREEECAKRSGQSSGKCVPTWFGLCHAWAPAAILEPEPVKPVVYNGVQFKVNDIKALITYSYNLGIDTPFMSERCNESEEKLVFDRYGNPIDTACVDSNPGSFHIVMANLLGIKKTAIIEDRQYDLEVWNQPIRSYRVTSEREISADDANMLIGALGDPILDEKKTGSLAEHNWSEVWSYDVAGVDGFSVMMKGSADPDLYIRFDGEPSRDAYDCSSTSKYAAETCNIPVPPGSHKAFVRVYAAKGSPNFTLEIRLTKGRAKTYVMNPRAVKFKFINMEISYVVESDPATDGSLSSLIDSYTTTDSFQYILELDSAGKILGGEWLGLSRKNHPDFLWGITAKSEAEISGIKWSDIKAILAQSIDTTIPVAPPVKPTVEYCVANNGRGEGDIFDCLVDGSVYKCAKTDRTYTFQCIIRSSNLQYVNLADNPGFEADGTTGTSIGNWAIWTPTSSAAASYTESKYPHGGEFYLAQFSPANYEIYTYQVKKDLANGHYSLKAWVRSSGGQSAAFMEAKDFGGNRRVQTIPASTTWQQIVIDGIAVTNGQCTYGFFSKSQGNQWINVDDVEFYRTD